LGRPFHLQVSRNRSAAARYGLIWPARGNPRDQKLGAQNHRRRAGTTWGR
jgi:hypothetical protein